MKTAERLEARHLRRLGWSVKEIERQLNVSRSSVSLWVDIQLTDEQICCTPSAERHVARAASGR